MKRMQVQSKLKLPYRVGGGTVRQQVKRLASQVSRSSPEIKFADTSLVQTNVTTAGAVIELTTIAAGTNQGERISDAIRVKSISFCLAFGTSAMSAAVEGIGFRLAIVQDMQQVGDTDATIAQIFGGGTPVDTFLNLDSLGRFKVLYMSKFMPNNMMDSAVGTLSPVVEWSTQCDIPVRYNGTAGTDIQKNGIFFITLSNDSADTIDTGGTCRLGFIDN